MTEPQENQHRILELIEQREWEAIDQLLQSNPELVHSVIPGTTVLHELLKIGSVPLHLIEQCATLAPEHILSPEEPYGDTCLHICCRNAQFSHAKLRVLLQTVQDDSDAQEPLKRTNRLGGTALHSAANHNATLETLSLLIQTCPSIVNVRTQERRHVLDVLFQGFLFTIHGHMHICKILNNESPKSSIFDRFWKKVRLIALETYYQSDRCSTIRKEDDDAYLVHGMLLCGNIPDKLLRLALKLTGTVAVTARDNTGNTPLHYYVRRHQRDDRPHRSEIRTLLHPAASCRNDAGFLPLHLAIRDRLPYHDYWGLVKTHAIDPETHLPPALLAASVAGREAVNSCFCLLRNRPEQIKRR